MRRRIFISICFCSPFVLPVAPASAQWIAMNGPYGGRVASLTQSGDLVFAGTEIGGVFLATDVSETNIFWSRSDRDLVVKSVKRFVASGDQLFAATSEGVIRTSDEGASWEILAEGGAPEGSITAIASTSGQILAYLKGVGLFISSDQGNLWEQRAGPDVRDVTNFLAADSLLFAGTTADLFVSTDVGLSWSWVDSNPVRTSVLVDSIILAGSKKIRRSSDGGLTWIEPDPTFPGSGNEVLTLLGFSGGVLYAGTRQGVFQTFDYGESWYQVSSGLPFEEAVNDLLFTGDLLLAGTDAGVYFSSNFGSEWQESSEGITGPHVRSLVWRDPFLFAGAVGSGVYRSSDRGMSWAHADLGITHRKITSLVSFSSLLLAGSRGGGLFVSPDNASTWTQVGTATGLTTDWVSTLLVSGSHVYAGTDDGLFESSDGFNWTAIGLAGDTVSALIDVGLFLIAGTIQNGIHRYVNRTYWEKVDTAGVADTTTTFILSGGSVLAGTRGGVYQSDDFGKSWVQVGNGLPDTTISAMVRGDELYAGSVGHGVFVSTDNGDSWSEWNTGLVQHDIAGLLRIDSLIIAGTTGGVVEVRRMPPGIPDLVGPDDQATDLYPPIELSWEPEAGADLYELQVCLRPEFDLLAIDTSSASSSVHLDYLAMNATYYWRVRGAGVGGSGRFSETREFTLSATRQYDTEIVETFPIDGATATDYRLISLPGITSFRLGDLFDGTNGVDWRAFAENGLPAPDNLVELTAEDTTMPGIGFWALSKGELRFSHSVTMPELNTNGTYRIPLQSGWNIIGNPFDRPVSVGAINEANAVERRFWTYIGGESFSDLIESLAPFKGYFVSSADDRDTLVLPYPFASTVPAAIEHPEIDWQLQLQLETSRGEDRQNFIGIAAVAESGRDRLDKADPPAFPGQPYLAFRRVGWSTTSMFSSDFRPRTGEGQTWDFEVASPSLLPFAIDVGGLDSLDGDGEIILLNMDTNEKRDLRVSGRQSFEPIRDITPFRLIAGADLYVRQQLDTLIPAEFALTPNYPNPFNPRTHMTVSLPREATVRLSVVSILGEEVAVMADGWYRPGRYTFFWDGRGWNGLPSATGVYFARLVVEGGPVLTHKMLMVK